MAKAERTEAFDVPVDKFYKAIIDYSNYPKFVDGVKSVDLKNATETGAELTMNLNIIKEISYTINLKHVPNKEVNWSLVKGDMMKLNNGRWTLKDLGNGKTEVTYSLEVELKGFLPGLGMIEKTLVSTNLPLTMKAFAKRAASL